MTGKRAELGLPRVAAGLPEWPGKAHDARMISWPRAFSSPRPFSSTAGVSPSHLTSPSRSVYPVSCAMAAETTKTHDTLWVTTIDHTADPSTRSIRQMPLAQLLLQQECLPKCQTASQPDLANGGHTRASTRQNSF